MDRFMHVVAAVLVLGMAANLSWLFAESEGWGPVLWFWAVGLVGYIPLHLIVRKRADDER